MASRNSRWLAGEGLLASSSTQGESWVSLLALVAAAAVAGALVSPPSGAAPSTTRDGRPTGGAFQSAAGRFRVVLPAQPREPERRSRPTVFGDVREARYEVELREAHVSIEHYDLPIIARALLPEAVLLDRAALGVVEDVNGAVVERRELSVQSWPARELSYELPGQPRRLERALLVLCGHRLYVVAVTWPAEQGMDAELSNVLASFQVWSR